MFITSIVSVYLPTHNPDPFKPAYWICLAFNFVICLLFFIGTKREKKDTIYTGFIMGIIIWSIWISIFINSLIWSQSQIIEPGYVYFIAFGGPLRQIGRTVMAFVGSIIHLIVTGVELICAIIIMKKTLAEPIFEDMLETEIPIHDGEIQTEFPIYEEVNETETPEESIELTDIFADRKMGQVPKTHYCSFCGKKIEKNAKFCTYCGLDLCFCEICKDYIRDDEAVSTCPFCHKDFHESEFLEWLKVKASCPVCKKEIDLWEFQKMSKKNG